MDAVRRQFETNVFGLMRMCQLVLPGMREAGRGRIVNISSMGGKLTFPGGGVYHATKHAVEALSDALRWEVAGFGIEVVIIEPGLIKTGFGDAAVGSIVGELPTEGPYATFNAHVGKATAGAYEDGGLGRLGGGPDAVAKKIETAITARNPKPRYRVTASATAQPRHAAMLSDRMWDRMLASQFPRPGDARDTALSVVGTRHRVDLPGVEASGAARAQGARRGIGGAWRTSTRPRAGPARRGSSSGAASARTGWRWRRSSSSRCWSWSRSSPRWSPTSSALPAPTPATPTRSTRSSGPPTGPSAEHLFGVDQIGRDVFARTVYGARVSLIVAFVATAIATVAGIVAGLLAGYFRGWTDTLISRSVDVLLAIPYLLLATGLASACTVGGAGRRGRLPRRR